MEDLKSYKVEITREGGLKIQSTEKLSPDELQPLVDTARLNQKTYFAHQKEIDNQHQIYTSIIVGLAFLAVLTFSFVTVRLISKVFQTTSPQATQHERSF